MREVQISTGQSNGLNGYEATRVLRDEGIKTPIVALTAYATETDAQKCRDAGCDDYLPKPFSPGQLHETVAKYLQPAVAVVASSSGTADRQRS